jgi:Cu/Ag efflux protein CusF
MNSPKVFAAIAMALLVTVSLTAAPLLQAPPGQAPPAGAQEQTATGQLAKVDATGKAITIKSGDKEMVFNYTDATQVTGVEGGTQGLAGKTGATLRVTYQSKAGTNLASRIEVQEAKK